MNDKNHSQSFHAFAILVAVAMIVASPALAQTAPTPTHTFQPTGSSGVFGTNTNWSSSTLPVAGSHVLIADGKTASMTQANADTLFGSLTLGVNSIVNLAASDNQGMAANSMLYFNNGSQLNFTSGKVNRGATYNILSGATAQMQLAGTTSSDSIPQGSLVGDSTTTVNFKVINLTNLRWDNASFSGTLNYQSNTGSAARVVSLTSFGGTSTAGPGTTNFDSFVRGTMGGSNKINDSGTLMLTGTSGDANQAKFDMASNSDTIGNFVIASPTGATATAPTLRGSSTLTISGTTTFQGTAGNVNFDSSNASPSTTTLLTTGSMTFGGTGTWAVAGDGRINLNATGGTRTITTNASASIFNTLVGTQGFTKAGAGSLTLNGSAANVLTGGISLNAGTLTLDYANMATPTNLVASGNALTLGGGNLLLRGKNSGDTSQTLGNVTMNAGGGTMLLNPNGGTSTGLVLGTFTATSQGSSLTAGTTIGAGAGTATITTTSNKDAQDIYGGRVVFANGTANTGYEWATTVSAGPAYTLSAYSGYAAMATSGIDTTNSRISASSTLVGSLTTNSLKIEDPAASQSLDLDVNSLVLNSGGLLVTGTNAVQITGASGNSLTTGNGSGSYDLVVHQYNSGGLDVGAVIANNGANATSLTKAGSGALTLSGSNTFTGGVFINDGTLTVANAGALNNTSGSENAVTMASSGALSLNGNSLVVSNLRSANTTTDGGIVQNANAAAATLTVGNSANLSGTFAGNLQNGTGGGALNLVKTGTGKLTLTNANTFTGSTDVNTGVLNIQNANALGTTAGSTTVASGAALEIQGGITVGAEALLLDGTGVSSGGALRNISGNNTYGGLVTLAGASRINSDAGLLVLSNTGTITGATLGLTVGGAGNTTIHSIIGTTTGTLTKENGGTLSLTGANTYTGGTTINAGTLAFANGSLGSSGNISFGGNSTLQWSNANTQDISSRIVMNNGVTSTFNTNSNNVTFASGIGSSSSGALTKVGNGTLTLSGNGTYTGNTTISAGALTLADTLAIQNSPLVNMATGTTLNLRKDSTGGTFTNTRLSPTGTVTIDANRISTGSGQTLTLGGTVVSISSALTQLNFTGGNSYNAGINAMYLNGGTTTLNPTTANAVIGAIRVNTSNTNPDGWGIGTSGNVGLVLGGGIGTNNTIASITEISAASTQLILTKNTAATWIINGNIDAKQGNGHSISAGTLTLNGTFDFDHAADRRLTLSGGILNYNNPAAIQTNSATASGNGLNITGGSLDNTSGAAITTSTTNPRMTWGGNWTFIGTNGANSDLNLGTGAVFLTATRQVSVTNAATTLTLGGDISGSGFGITKAGDGRLVLSGASSYTGATNVNAGTLNIAIGGSTHASSAVTVSNASSALVVDGTLNGTLVANASTTISGSGTVVGAATVSGNLTPGNSPGELNFSNSLTLAGTTATTMEINGDSLGLNYDNIDVGTTLTYDGALTLAIGAVFAADKVFDLFEFGSQTGSFDSVTLTGLYTGTLTNDGFGIWATTTNSGDETWSFSQTTGDLTLTVIPEPSAALLGSLGLLALLRRRR